MRGIYIHKQEGDKVWGHILWLCHGLWTVNTFRGSTLSFVTEQAEAFIHEPRTYLVEQCGWDAS